MLFKEAQDQLGLEVKKDGGDSDISTKLKSSLNFAKIEVGKSFNWKELRRESELVIIPNYTTGTVSYTQDSRIVTGSGTNWTSAMVGRFFQAANTSYWYRIASVASATQLTLESPIIEASASGQTYEIWKKYYRVNSDIRVVLPDETKKDLPIPFTIEGYDPAATGYSTGIVIATKDSAILNGTGTAFLDNVFPGDLITIQAASYRVKAVDSDTQITMVNKATADFVGEYEISSESPYQAEFKGAHGGATASEKVLTRYYYLRQLFHMVNDADSTELSVKFDRCILDFAKAEYRRLSDSPSWEKDYQIAQLRLEKLKMDSSLVWYPYRTFPPLVQQGMGRGDNRTIITG